MDNFRNQEPFAKQGLYDPRFEHDNCGIGAVVNINGIKSRKVVDNALSIVETLEHRAGKDAEGKTGDGVGILLQICHEFFKDATADLGFDIGEERDYGSGMFFFPQNKLKRLQAMKLFEIIIKKENLEFLVNLSRNSRLGILEFLKKLLRKFRILSKSKKEFSLGILD